MDIRTTLASYQKRQSTFFKIAKDLAKKYNIKILYPHKYMCGEEFCNIVKNGIPLYSDENHLSIYGAMQLKEMAREAITFSP
jgi:hypothetical protein